MNDLNNFNYTVPKQKKISPVVLAIILSSVISLVVGIGGVLMVLHFVPGIIADPSSNVVKTEKVVTVTDKGISDAVSKVYDSVVIVKNYSRNRLVSTGTGFVYKKSDNKYFLLTNYHVIEGAESVNVVFTNGKEANVNVEGGNKYSDLAVLSYVSPKPIKIADIGSSIDSKVGDTVFAIGAPLNSEVYSWSVTRGVLSGKDRKIAVNVNHAYEKDWVMQVLQTDAAINSGNSGGPLCNSNGEVVGITNMKLVTQGVEGMGFAIPIEDATTFADSIIFGVEAKKPYLGISMLDGSVPDIAEKFGVSPNVGVLIAGVDERSTAYASGLRTGDIITKVGTVSIVSESSLRHTINNYKVGDVVTIYYIRKGEEFSTNVRLSGK